MMWRCFKCETYNNGESCFICGTGRNVRPPRPHYAPAAAPRPRPAPRPAPPEESTESKMWIPALIILGCIIFILLIVIINSL